MNHVMSASTINPRPTMRVISGRFVVGVDIVRAVLWPVNETIEENAWDLIDDQVADGCFAVWGSRGRQKVKPSD